MDNQYGRETTQPKVLHQEDVLLIQMQAAILEGDQKKWLSLYSLDDDVTLKALSNWFEIYCSNPELEHCSWERFPCKEPETVCCRWTFSYGKWDTVTEIVTYQLCHVGEILKIHWMEKQTYLPAYGHCDFRRILRKEKAPISCDWAMAACGIELEAAQQYSRAVSRSIRFREGNPLIECASILACMMSQDVYEMSQEIKQYKKSLQLFYLYNSLVWSFEIRILRDDRGNAWSSKYTAPWYGLEEALAIHSSEGRVPINCHLFMVLFYSILRICGWSSRELLLFRTGDHDHLLIWQTDQLFLVDNSGLFSVTSRLLLPFRFEKLTLYDETWVDIVEKLEKDAWGSTDSILRSLFAFRERKKGLGLPEFHWRSDADSTAFTRFVDQCCLTEPDSPYTWARYAFQSLGVTKPEAYVYWSIKNQTIKKAAEQLPQEINLLAWVQGFARGSIFQEEDRLMTADQVLRCHRGDVKALAVMLYALLKRKYDGVGGVIFTSKSIYCAFCYKESWTLLDLNLFQKANDMDGQILLVANESSSYFPLRADTGSCPEWFLHLCKKMRLGGGIAL